MNNIVHSECPLCRQSFPADALPAHLAAHRDMNMLAAVDRADWLAAKSNQEIADLLRVCVGCEMNPLSWECSIVEAAVARLEKLV